jgi:hypothetical protein
MGCFISQEESGIREVNPREREFLIMRTFTRAYWRILILLGSADVTINELAETLTAEAFTTLRCEQGDALNDLTHDELLDTFLTNIMAGIYEEDSTPEELYPAIRVAFTREAEAFLCVSA